MNTLKKKLNFKQILNLNLGMLGVLFAWQLTLANMSGIYSFFGAKPDDLGYLWLVPSILGLVIPLIVGYLSDRTNTLFGKRLPYIFWGAWITVICLFLLPNSPSLFSVVVLFCIFTATINAALQPFRPLVADVAVKNVHTQIYAVQAALMGVGATLASLTPWLLLRFFGKANFMHAHTAVPPEIKFAFYLGGVVLALTVTWTTILTKKYLPATPSQHTAAPSKNLLTTTAAHIPKVMWQVSAVQFFTWLGAFCFIIYLTPEIEQAIFFLMQNGANLLNESPYQILEKSVVLSGVASGVYMFTSIVYAYLIPVFSKKIARKNLHFFSLCIGGIALISLLFIHQTGLFLLAMIGVGIAWASMNSIPFAMIAKVLPEKRLGIYMAIFNVTICLPQIITSLGAGYILKTWLHNSASLLMVLAGVFWLIGAGLTLIIKDQVLG